MNQIITGIIIIIIFIIIFTKKEKYIITPNETINKATQDIKNILNEYNISEDTLGDKLDESRGVIEDKISDPKLYESFILSKILKTALFKAQQKGLLKSGSAGAKIIAKALEKVALKATAKITEEIGIKLAEMSLGLEAGPPGWLFDIFQLAMLATDLWDPAGFNQFSTNKEIIIPTRNSIEKATIKNKNKKPPYIFNIDNVKYSQTLKPLNNAFKEGIQQYIISLIDDAIKQIPDESYVKYINNSDEFVDIIVQKILEKNPSKRDKTIFDYMVLKLPNLKQFIEYHNWLSTKDNIAITLSKKGAELFNKETLNNENVVFMAVYSKYYRDLDRNDNIISKQLQKPITQQSFLKPIMNMCTTTSLTKNMELFKKLPRANVDPSKYGVTFNSDLGICSYTKNYCERFGMVPTSKVSDGISYTDCKNLPGEEVASLIFGTTLTHGAVFLGEKGVDGVENAYTETRKSAVETYGEVKNFFSEESKNIADDIIVAGTSVKDTVVNVTKTIEDTTTDVIEGTKNVVKSTTKSVSKFVKKWFSDSRLKMNIKKIPNKVYGRFTLPVYTWKWIPNNKFGLSGQQWGVMASDVMTIIPDAVKIVDGYYYVNYNLIK